MKIQVNVTTKVNSQQIRREQHNGRDHLILPSYTLPANVIMNGGLYPASEIDTHYKGLEGTLAPLGHPSVNGQFVSAFSPEGINVGHIGAFNRNVKKAGNRVYLEKWVDIEVAQRSEGGKRLLERVDALERGESVPPIHTSVAVFLEQLEANEEQKQSGAQWVAKITGMDHDAILLDEVGAATPEQGVGLMVNADLAECVKVNSGALVGESFREKEARLDRAAKERFVKTNEDYAWVADFTDTQAVIVQNSGISNVYGYTVENGKVSFSDTGTPVIRQEGWIAMVANAAAKLKDKFFNPQARPVVNEKEGDMPMTAEEKAELTQEISKAVTANMAQALADAVKPVNDTIQELKANKQAAADAVDAEKRKAVAAVHGDLVANSLKGDALDVMHKSLASAATLAPNASTGAATGLTADANNLPD